MAAATAVLVTACSGGSSPGASSSNASSGPVTSGSTSSAPTSSSVPSSTTSATSSQAVLADGRHPAYLTDVDAAHRRITVDVVQFFTGEAASRAAEQDGADEVPPPNDYWIRNVSKRLRTLPIAADARITTNVLTDDVTGSATQDHAVTLADLDELPYPDHLFWVTVREGTVTRLAEQFLP